ncbi:MAG: twitching motility protein PilT [Clostridiales bacterium]|jgi:hypothetical protein|nr:twitching motility protein PilT [Clostridiales bacterium]
MIKFIAGGKGEGKTKLLIDIANAAAKTTEGHLVFIDDDSRHIYDLHYDIRFIDTSGFPLSNYREFIGFLCGILSQDNDIVEIFVDGICNIVKNIDNDELVELINKLQALSVEHELDFTISMNNKYDNLPEAIKPLVINREATADV